MPRLELSWTTIRRIWRSYFAERALGTRDSSSFALSFAFVNSSCVTMDTLPGTAERWHMLSERLLHCVQFVLCEAKVLAQGGWASWAVQLEDGLFAVPHQVDVCRTVVVRIDDDAEDRAAARRWAPV